MRRWAPVILLAAGCASTPLGAASEDLHGTWRATLASPGGPLPFELFFGADGASAQIINGSERMPVDVRRSDARVRVDIAVYDATITATLADDGRSMVGRWRKTTRTGESSLPFAATRGFSHRFVPALATGTSTTVSGIWRVTFTDNDGPYVARGELEQSGPIVRGTFLTATGDFRFLEGRFEGDHLRLSTFDGAHAFLFTADLQADGSLKGDFWSRDVYHATWVASREAPGASNLPDPFREVSAKAGAKLRGTFTDLAGAAVSLEDPRFAGKVLLVDVFGTWCPNCNDLAPLLARWHRRYRDRGFEVIGLAYELTGDDARDRRQVAEYKRRYGLAFPLLLAGTSNKSDAAKTLPMLSAIKSYPTSIFVDRTGAIRRIHSGFAGPATGRHHLELIAAFEREIEALLAEK